MSRNIAVSIARNNALVLAAGILFAHCKVDVTDAAGAVQSANLDGTESPPFTATFTSLADGAGSVVATDLDTTGAVIGTPATTTFPAVIPTGTPFQSVSGITVTAAP